MNQQWHAQNFTKEGIFPINFQKGNFEQNKFLFLWVFWINSEQKGEFDPPGPPPGNEQGPYKSNGIKIYLLLLLYLTLFCDAEMKRKLV